MSFRFARSRPTQRVGLRLSIVIYLPPLPRHRRCKLLRRELGDVFRPHLLYCFSIESAAAACLGSLRLRLALAPLMLGFLFHAGGDLLLDLRTLFGNPGVHALLDHRSHEVTPECGRVAIPLEVALHARLELAVEVGLPHLISDVSHEAEYAGGETSLPLVTLRDGDRLLELVAVLVH